MKLLKIPFFRLSFTSAERKEVLDTVNSGWVTTGPKVERLEGEIRKLTGAKYAAAVSSGTAGLHLALASYNIGRGDEVITTPYTMSATVQAILYTGAKPVFVDIDPHSLNIDPTAVESKVSKKTRAIVTVDIAGCPADYDALRKPARKHNLRLIDDAAHSLGADFNGRPIGSIADATVFSFYSTKNITTGEGGMVVSDSKTLINRIRHLLLHGMTSSGYKRYQGGNWKYDVTDLGYKYNMSDLAGALGLGQLTRFDKLQNKRRRLAARYLKKLANLTDYIELPYCGGRSAHAWHLFIIKMHPRRWKIGRNRLIRELDRLGVGCGVHFIPVYRFSYFRKIMKYKPSDFRVCEDTFKRVISVPLYPDLTFHEVDYVCDAIRWLIYRHGR
ncbi:MAG: DegT/DnrJ/EryC1/StrS family aminotransferase [Candidatus Zixiibacteriota bacterium]|nr:MAG: DegT/DnrJ/EryC1/StrS family aminotransferase [candidate division Zixibacteria bacterium]